MATVSPVLSVVDSVPRVTWTSVSTADTMESFPILGQTGLAAAVQMTGTWGGATVSMKVSNDDSTYFTVKDVNNADVSATGDAYFEMSTAAAYIKPASSGGVADTVDVVLVLRGPSSNV